MEIKKSSPAPLSKSLLFYLVFAATVLSALAFVWVFFQTLKKNEEMAAKIRFFEIRSKQTDEAISALKASQNQVDNRQQVTNKNIANLRANYLRALAESRRLEAQNTAIQNRLDEFSKAADTAQKELAARQKEAQEKESAIAALREQITHLESEIKSAEDKKISREHVRANNEKIKDLQKSKNELQKQLRQVTDSKRKAENELKKQLQKLTDAKRRADEALKRSAAYQKTLMEKMKRSEIAVKDSKKAIVGLKTAGTQVENFSRDAALAHYNLGVLYMKGAHYEEAASEFEHALHDYPGDPATHYNLGILYDAYLSQPKLAIRHYEAYVRLLPNAEDAKKVQYRIFQVQTQYEKGLDRELQYDEKT